MTINKGTYKERQRNKMKRKSMSAYIQVSAKCMGACFCMGVFISLGQSKLSFRVMWGSVKNVCRYYSVVQGTLVHTHTHTHTSLVQILGKE